MSFLKKRRDVLLKFHFQLPAKDLYMISKREVGWDEVTHLFLGKVVSKFRS